jgi:hypothetical protein
MNKILIMMIVLVWALAPADASAWGRRNRAVNRNKQVEKLAENTVWTVQTVATMAGVTTVTLKGSDEVKQLKISQMTEVVIDGASTKPDDIKTGMKSISFIMEGNSLPLSRIVLESNGENSKGKKGKKGG